MSNQKVCDVCNRPFGTERTHPKKYVAGTHYPLDAQVTLAADLYLPADPDEDIEEEWETNEWTLDVCASCLPKMFPNLKELMEQANREINGV